MADLTITAAQVMPSTGAKYLHGKAGEALTQGQPVYKKSSDGLYYKADADASDTAEAAGICMCAASASGQAIIVQFDGDVDLGAGAAAAAGQTYCVSATAGGIAPEADIGSGDYVTYLGYGIGSNKLRLDIKATATAHA